ncbi:MAG: Fic family protein [Bacillota bacterium]|nr:Fic family protein [Bacillota bacterium]
MNYLFKLYYADKEAYLKTYESRFNFETTLKTRLYIKPYQSEESFQLYYVYNRETATYIDIVKKNDLRLEELSKSLPGVAKDAFLLDLISSELQSTNNLEGIKSEKSAIIETARNLLEAKKFSKERFESMVNSYVLLIEKEKLKRPVDSKDIRTIYDKITQGEIEDWDLPDGKYFRKEAVFVQKRNSLSGQAIHKGVQGEDNINQHIADLLRFLEEEDLELLLKVAISHYYFGYIHPFYDGNGRVSRFIASLILRENYNYLTAMSLARGSWIKKNSYYKAFDKTNSAINRGELNYFVDEFLKIIIEGQEDIINNLSDKVEKLKKAYDCIEKETKLLNTELKRVIMFLLFQNYYFDLNQGLERTKIIDLAKEKFSVNGIKNELVELQEAGLIKVIKKHPLIYIIEEKFLRDL